MRNIIMLLLIICGLISCKPINSSNNTDNNFDPEIEAKITKLLGSMEVIDKVGEMTQLSLDMISEGEIYNLKEPHTLNKEKLKKVLLDLRVGSILNCGAHANSNEHWNEIITAIQKIATEEKSTKIPVLYGIDAIHGMNYTQKATLFPQQLGLASTWNPALGKELAQLAAYECRASGIQWNFSPVLDLGRDVRWSRLWEGFGEDVLLARRMGTGMIEGYQGNNIGDDYSVASCMKHFIGYSQAWSGKDRSPNYIPERQLREYFLPTFQDAVDAGAATVMINSGEVNGIPGHINSWLLQDILRDELGFEGLAVTDWEDIVFLFSRHKVAKDYKEAVKMAINAGIDMSMVATDLQFPVLLRELVEEGEVPMSRIDDAVRRILRLKFQLGLFDNPYPEPEKYPDFGSEKHRQQALKGAQESIILAKNDGVLPLKKDARVLVTGPTANVLASLNGGWTNTWQGRAAEWDTPGKQTLFEAIEMKGRSVKYVEGTKITEPSNNSFLDVPVNIPEAVRAARQSDVAVVCLGELPYTEKAGDIDDFNLPKPQQDLVKAIAKTGTPIVLVFLEGRPRIFSEIEPMANGVILGFLPGNEGGHAIADVLFGDINPSGKLPITYPKHANTILHYDHKGTDKVAPSFAMDAFQPQYNFGHGLSYTTFEYSNLVAADSVTMNGKINITVDVKNTGAREGAEVIQLFITDEVATITPGDRRLRGFEKVNLKSGESKKISFELDPSELAFVGVDQKWVTEKGDFTIRIGGQEKKFFLY